ncbi:hypothetical protein [Noviherbaspirillum galbum]|uniref:Uncharacterized protein n=1 Tax=Noviherbaspirillum galbum TaxID=2709383 RepID=A0A6B3SRG4_9BURK|nr:hypothetical protein [Noviherbaspirillum galbum]NEX61376.1 hypothetical protein [Noviherbaspirillum galbum]
MTVIPTIAQAKQWHFSIRRQERFIMPGPGSISHQGGNVVDPTLQPAQGQSTDRNTDLTVIQHTIGPGLQVSSKQVPVNSGTKVLGQAVTMRLSSKLSEEAKKALKQNFEAFHKLGSDSSSKELLNQISPSRSEIAEPSNALERSGSRSLEDSMGNDVERSGLENQKATKSDPSPLIFEKMTDDEGRVTGYKVNLTDLEHQEPRPEPELSESTASTHCENAGSSTTSRRSSLVDMVRSLFNKD